MKKLTFVLASTALLAASAAVAAPDKPINAAVTDSGNGCIVHAGETDPYVGDADCAWKTVTKSNKAGDLEFFIYQDKGTLQPGQTAPKKAVKVELVGFVIGGLPCTGSEVISPSGNYSSSLKCS